MKYNLALFFICMTAAVIAGCQSGPEHTRTGAFIEFERLETGSKQINAGNQITGIDLQTKIANCLSDFFSEKQILAGEFTIKNGNIRLPSGQEIIFKGQYHYGDKIDKNFIQSELIFIHTTNHSAFKVQDGEFLGDMFLCNPEGCTVITFNGQKSRFLLGTKYERLTIEELITIYNFTNRKSVSFTIL